MLYGVDVHDGYQRGLSFPLLKQQGYSFAAVKLTQGTNYQRDMGDDWIVNARNAGLVAGGYHWLNSEPGAAQARWFWRKLQEVGGPEGLLIQCDNEDNATWQVTKDWAAEWEQLSQGHPFLMYSGGWWWRPRGWDGASLTPYLWDSRYIQADADTIPDDPAKLFATVPASWWLPAYGGWQQSTFLQFTSKGDAGGLGNNVDLNATKLSMEQLLALTTSEDDMALTTPEHARVMNTAVILDYVCHRGADEIPPGKLLDDKGNEIQTPWDLRPFWKRIAAEVAKNPTPPSGLVPHTHTAGETGPAVPTGD